MKPNLMKAIPQMGDVKYRDVAHSKEVDLSGLRLAQEMPGVKIYCLSEEGSLKDYVALADIQNENPMRPEHKSENAIVDFAVLPPGFSMGKIEKFFRRLKLQREYEILKQTMVWQVCREIWILIKTCAKIPLRLLLLTFRRN